MVMVLVIVGSHRFHVDPDNVATPIAASLGDLVTLSVLAGIGQLFYMVMNSAVSAQEKASGSWVEITVRHSVSGSYRCLLRLSSPG